MSHQYQEPPPTFEELMTWADTGVPPEQQSPKPAERRPPKPDSKSNSSIVGETLSEKLSSPPPRTERMARTWMQGAIAAAAIAVLELLSGMTWADGVDWRIFGFAIVQAVVTGVLSYYHSTQTEKGEDEWNPT